MATGRLALSMLSTACFEIAFLPRAGRRQPMVPPKVNKIGKYEILEVIGHGGMGQVYKAVDPTIGRMVAIKKVTSVFSDDPLLLKRFYREAHSTGALQHPNIVTVYDLGDQDGIPYLVMEYLEGESLEKIIKEKRSFTLTEKLNIMIQACEGLGYAHQRQIIHRDVKPGNVVVLKDGVVKIVDFGIAQLGNERFTRTGQVIGSLYYMSPEQIQGLDVDSRSDIYSTGVLLFEFIAGVLPFQGKDPTSTLAKILQEPPPLLSNFVQPCPPELDTVIQRALAKDRNDRFTAMEDFIFELQSVQEKLSRDVIAKCLRVAEVSMETRDWTKAREQLKQVLKLDKQHRRANELLREVQSQIQKQQITEQVGVLRSQAEEALAARRWDDALTLLDQAVRLDGTNSQLIEFRNSVRRSNALLTDALRRAEMAHSGGDLDTAKRAVEEALSVDPSDTTAKALNAILSKEIGERSKRKKIDELLGEARKEITLRHYTSALELLRQAEAVDGTVAELHQLVRTATAGREHELRRRALEEACSEIEDLLNRDEYAAACDKADTALQRFPDELGLLKLRSFAEKQRDAWTRRLFIERQIATARELLEAGQLIRAQGVLNDALERYPDDSGLISLLSMVTDTITRQDAQRREAERQAAETRRYINLQISAAAELQRSGQTALALKKVRDALQHYPSSQELQAQVVILEDLLALEQEQRERAEQEAHRKRAEIEKELANSQQLLGSRQTGQAVAVLEQALRRYPESQELKSQLEFAQRRWAVEIAERERAEQEARRQRAEIERERAKVQQLLDARQASRAVAELEQALREYPESEELKSQLEIARQHFAIEQAERERFEQETRRQQAEIEKEIAAARQLLDSNQASRALASLEQSLRRYPESEKLKSERSVVQGYVAAEQARREQAEQEARRRQAWIDGEITSTRQMLNSNQAGRAVEALEQGLRQYPSSEELKSQLELARQRLAIQQEEQERAEQQARLRQEDIEREVAKAAQLLESRQTSLAMVGLEKAVRRYPDSTKLKAQLELAQQRMAEEEAERRRIQAELRRQTEIDEAFAAALHLLNSRQTDRAVATLEESLRKFPDSLEIKTQLDLAKRRFAEEEAEKQRIQAELLKRAEIEKGIAAAQQLLNSNQAAQAISSLEESLRRFPDSLEIKTQLELAKRRVSEEAEKQRIEAERRRRAEIEKGLTAAQQLLNSNQAAQAVSSLEQSLRRFPDSVELKTQLDLAERRLAEEEAEKQRIEAERRRRTEIERAIASAQQLLESNQTSRAVSTLEQSVRSYPDSEELTKKLQDAQRQLAAEQAEREKAEQEARRLQAEISKEIGASRRLLDSGQTAQAVASLEQAVQRFPQSKEIQAQLDVASQRLVREQEEKARAEELAARRRREIESRIVAARQWLDSKRTQDAVDEIQKSAREFPESAELQSLLAAVQQRLKQEREEQAKAAREAQIRRERIAAEVESARRLLKANQSAKACEGLEKAVELYPESEELRSQLAAGKGKLAQEQAEREEAEKRRARLAAEISRAQALLDSGKPDEAVQAVEGAVRSLGKNPQLQSLLEAAKAAVKQKKAEEKKRLEVQRQAAELKRLRERDLGELKKLADGIASASVAVLEKRVRQAQALAGKHPDDGEFQESFARVRGTLRSAIDGIAEQEVERAQTRMATRVFAPAEEPRAQVPVAEEPAEVEAREISKLEPERKRPPLASKWIVTAAAIAVVVVGGIVVKVVVFPTPKLFTVHIESQPAGAKVRVGNQTCTTPNCQLSLPAGTYQVNAELQGYQPHSEPLVVDAKAAEPTVSVNLVAIPRGSFLVVRTGVDGADVLVNGKKSEQPTAGGILRLPLAPGEYQVEVRKSGYLPVKPKPARVSKDEETTVSFDLKLSPTMAALTIHDAKPNAQVFADGHYLGLTASDGSFTHELDPGKHQVLLSLDGRKSSVVSSSFTAGNTGNLDGKEFKFPDVPPPVHSVMVAVRNLPAGAFVTVDGHDRHQADNSGVAKFEVPAGSHTLELSRDNFKPRTLSQSFTGQTTLDGSMEAAPNPEDAEWASLSSSNDMAALQGFLNKYSGGKYAQPAGSRLEKLVADNQNESELENFAKKFPNTPAGGLAEKKVERFRLDADQKRTEEQDRRDIQSLMNNYKAAYEHRDFNALVALYPLAQKANQTKFKNANSVTMELSTDQPDIKGEQATVKVRQKVTWVGKDKAESVETPPQLTFTLAKKDGHWLIQKGP